MKLTVVSLKLCPYVQRVISELEVRGAPYDVKYIEFPDTPKWFQQVSPQNQVPILITGNDVSIFESDAIITYIEESYGHLSEKQSAEKIALNHAWSLMATSTYMAQYTSMQEKESNCSSPIGDTLIKKYALLESQIKGDYFNGDKISKVDLALLPLLHREYLYSLNSKRNILDAFPRLTRLKDALINLDLFRRTTAKDFEDNFISFYSPSEHHTESDVSENKASNCY